ncbi:GNAT family N-acetyltransferase [Desulfovibrio inopinatus]|uniref:GNAT family N-acetyltransferase n=1 Tax=Desulfovibrio inopinatus TaxID=102109 RepID=UPI0004202A4E|nr:GNAT family N-acetyltransferase [Desulfovibrio inopinatus]
MKDVPAHNRMYKAALEIPYDVRFIPTVQHCSANLLKLGGGDPEEIRSFSLALDEVLCFIIDAYPDEDMLESIHLDIELFDDGVVIASIRNTGPPIHASRIPQYDSEAPLSDVDGLWFYLARKLVDDLQFVNRGMDGWLVVIKKALATTTFKMAAPRAATHHAKTRDFSIRLAEPGDASELIDLAYDTYRYTYTDPEFYDEKQLQNALESGQMVSLVLTTEGGGIIGQIAFYKTPEENACAYVGGLMIGTAYRRTRAAFIMTQKLEEFVEKNPLDVDLYWGCSVTAHTLSQKLVARIGAHPLALFLMVGPPVTYSNMTIDSQERESYVSYLRLTKENKLSTLYLPAPHHDVMSPLLAQVNCNASLSADTAEPVGSSTTYIVHEFINDSLAHIRLNELGSQWSTDLRKKIFSLRNKEIDSIVIHIPAWQPLPPDIDAVFMNLNAVFCGVSAISVQEYYVVYCAPVGNVNFDNINLADPLAERLKDYIQGLYKTMLGG